MGDLYTPNMFARTDRYTQSNYHQFLLRKQVGKRVNTSFDYTWQSKNNTLTEAVWLNIPESRVLDTVRFETYQRLNTVAYPELDHAYSSETGKGYAITLDKNVCKQFEIEGGYASIDTSQTILTQEFLSTSLGLSVNGDSYGIGNRYFVRPVVKLTPYLEATGYYTHGSGTPASPYDLIWNHQAIQAGLNFNMKKAIFHKPAAQ